MKFNPTTEFDSAVKKIDDLAGTNVSTYPLTRKARSMNTGMDEAMSILLQYTDTKNYDDPNFATLPQGTYDITIGERNLTVNKDEDGADIMKIYRVIAKDSNGDWYNLKEMDIRSPHADNIAYGTDTGKISAYDWVGSSMVFDVTPEATVADGIKVFYARNSTYFTETDTTKNIGLPAIYQMYPVIYAAWEYCWSKGLQKAKGYDVKLKEMREEMKKFASSQTLVANTRMTPHIVSAK